MTSETFTLTKIKLIVGLGNLGKQFENTKHNIGFMLLDHLTSLAWSENSKLNSFIVSETISNEKVILAKPTTFMNLSGDAVQKIMAYYKILPEEILIVHDDLDIRLGEYKIQFAKGPKDHNGIIDIDNKLGTTNYWRLRIGVDNRSPEQKKFMSGRDYVLERFNQKELELITTVFDEIVFEIY